ncbi:MAG: hypothetical protein ACR2H4_18830 [Pyrinomonadaceae bacterium]
MARNIFGSEAHNNTRVTIPVTNYAITKRRMKAVNTIPLDATTLLVG